MNNLPRQALRRIVDKYGTEIGGDARRCESLLNDFCGSHRREINVLVNAIEERVPLDLLNGVGSMPLELLLTRLEKRLAEQTAMTAEAASWAVESWASALGAATNAEIEARAAKRARAAASSSDAPTIQPKPAADNAPPRINPPKPVQTTKPPPIVPPSRLAPPSRPPNNPPVILPANNRTINAPAQPINAPVQTATTNQITVARRSFGFFRGCLLVIFLLVVSSIALFFVVPYAIETMRETQRERNSEPPRFPIR